MGSCKGSSSSIQRPTYVRWCVESPAPVVTALTAAAPPEDQPHLRHQPAASRSIPLLLLTPPEISRQTSAVASPQSPRSPLTKGTRGEAVTRPHHSQLSPLSGPALRAHEDEESEKGRKEHFRLPEAGDNKKNLHLEDESFLLPRSSPVISKGFRPLSWHGGDTNKAAPSGEASSSSLDSSSRSLSLDQRGGLTAKSLEDLAGRSTSTQASKERRCSDVPELSADIFKTSCDLEKENAHFIVVDMVLEVLEGVKWTVSFNRWTHCEVCTHTHWSSAGDVRPHEQTQTRNTRKHAHACNAADPKPDSDVKASQRSPHPSHVNTLQHTLHEEDKEETGNHETQQQKSSSVLSTDSGFEDSGADTTLTPRASLQTVEWLAQQLVLEFRRSWFPSHEPLRRQQSLLSSLQELPGTECMGVSSGSLTDEIRLRTRMRGSLSWTPPHFQIIFTVHPSHRRSEAVALQHFLCAGCGTEVEPKYTKKLRYCEYLGRYFCDCCHSGSEAVIPGRVLSCWDFGRYPVSDFSKQLLDSTWSQPLFDLSCVGQTLYSRVKELDKFRELQEQLLGIKRLLEVCRLSGRVTAEFEQLPAHVLEQPPLFSMDDLLKVKRGQLVLQARAVLHSALSHVQTCKLCLARGFICEVCRDKGVIFPFQTVTCQRCPVCRACFHKHCFVEKNCPKCARIQSRRKRRDGSVKCD